MARQVHITLTDEQTKALPIEAQKDDNVLQSLLQKMFLYSLQWQRFNEESEEKGEEEAEEEKDSTSCVFPVSEDRYAYQASEEEYTALEMYAQYLPYTPEELFRYWVEANIHDLKFDGPVALRLQADRRIQRAEQEGPSRHNAHPLVQTSAKGKNVKHVFYTSKEEYDQLEEYAQCCYETTATLFQTWLQHYVHAIAMHKAILEEPDEELWPNPFRPPETTSASDSTQAEGAEEPREEKCVNV